MTNYSNYGVTLSTGQAQKIKKALEEERDVTIRLKKDQLTGNIMLPLTDTQINKIRNVENGVQLKLSRAQLKHMEKSGGFLPLLALIPAAIGAASALAGGVAGIVNSTKQTREMKRHNKAIEEELAKQQISGQGIISDAVAPIPVGGKKLSNILKKIGLGQCSCKGLKGAVWGNGIYLEREGSGLFLGREWGCE